VQPGVLRLLRMRFWNEEKKVGMRLENVANALSKYRANRLLASSTSGLTWHSASFRGRRDGFPCTRA
jgi:hypothetical protein